MLVASAPAGLPLHMWPMFPFRVGGGAIRGAVVEDYKSVK